MDFQSAKLVFQLLLLGNAFCKISAEASSTISTISKTAPLPPTPTTNISTTLTMSTISSSFVTTTTTASSSVPTSSPTSTQPQSSTTPSSTSPSTTSFSSTTTFSTSSVAPTPTFPPSFSTSTSSTMSSSTQPTTYTPDERLSTGAIAGISVACAVVIILVIVIPIIICRKKRRKQHGSSYGNDSMDDNSDPEINRDGISKMSFDSGIEIPESTPKPTSEEKPVHQIQNEVSHVTENCASSDISTGPYINDRPELVISIEKLNEYVKSRKIEGDMFEEEYHSLPDDSQTPCLAATSDDCLTNKNWYRNIYPFDHNRVILDVIEGDPSTDYINASHIQGYLPVDRYIATLGPRPATKDDFWRMVWQEKVDTIVMVTNLEENCKVKCERYWPEMIGTSMKLGSLGIKLEEERSTLHDITRRLTVTYDSKRRTVMQYHFTVWPDHGVPPDPLTLINFRKKVSPRVGHGKPVVVHCSAGVGRTGTFIALDSLIKQGETERQVNVFSFVSGLRLQRRHMIQTVAQYVFLHEALVEYFKLGDTAFSSSDANDTLKLLIAGSTGPESANTLLKQYKVLEENAPKPDPDDLEAPLNKVNIIKNRFISIIPFLSRRVFLRCPVDGGNDYINAITVDSYYKKNAFYVTHVPLENTVSDYWRMIYESGSSTVVVVRFKSHAWEVPNFLPEKNKPMPFKGSIISLRSSSTHSAYRIIHLDMISKDDKSLDDSPQDSAENDDQFAENSYLNIETLRMIRSEAKRLRVFEITVPEDEELMDHQVIIDVYEEVLEWTRSKNEPVVVSCLNGAGYCGQYVACSNLFDMINAENNIDPFLIVKRIKESRPEFIPNFKHYKSLHEAALLYLAKDPPLYYNVS